MTFLDELAKKMGDAGYCNYSACKEYLTAAFEAGRVEGREEGMEEAAKIADEHYQPYVGITGGIIRAAVRKEGA